MSRYPIKARIVFLLLILMMFTVPVMAAEPFEIHVLDVDQGQSVLVEADGHYMLFDGGGRRVSSFVVSYLKQQGTTSLDCIAVSHYEEDHMCGIIGVLSAFPCNIFLVPPYAGNGDIYQSLAVAALSNGCEIIHPEPGFEISLGNAIVRIIGPQRTDYVSDNDLSLCMTIQYGDSRVIICGDAQHDSETDLINSEEDVAADIYVVNHHGSSTSSMDAFLDRVSPRFAVISCGKVNGYGHPSMETLQRLQTLNVSMFRTDVQGSITAYSDGTDIWFSKDPCTDWTAGDGNVTFPTLENDDGAGVTRVHLNSQKMAGNSVVDTEQEQDFQYVCNTNTKKFHYPGCDSVSQMKEANRLNTNLTREELLAEGYEPCGNCKP